MKGRGASETAPRQPLQHLKPQVPSASGARLPAERQAGTHLPAKRLAERRRSRT